MRHALIVGARGVGKSTLIRRVLRELNIPYFGYETKKEKHLTDPIHGDPIYIYPAGAEHVQRPDNLLGYCKQQRPEVHAAAFDRHAPALTRVPEGRRSMTAPSGLSRRFSLPPEVTIIMGSITSKG